MKNGIDIGCGTGEQTRLLSEKFDQAFFLGIDPSPEMLSDSKKRESNRLRFQQSNVEEFLISGREQSWDLIFSNAALQWSDNHRHLFPELIARLSDKGQFAVQMPAQKDNLLNQLLLKLAQEKPFVDFLQGWKRESPVLSIDEYARIMFENGLQHIQIVQKVYPILADGPEKLFDFISGSALIPYLERLPESEQKLFVSEFKRRISDEFQPFPALYAFKRLLLYGKRC